MLPNFNEKKCNIFLSTHFNNRNDKIKDKKSETTHMKNYKHQTKK